MPFEIMIGAGIGSERAGAERIDKLLAATKGPLPWTRSWPIQAADPAMVAEVDRTGRNDGGGAPENGSATARLSAGTIA